jgi:hypothetical protein
MSLLNINIGLLAYVDGPSSNQPRLRQADLQWSLMGIPTENFKNIPISLAPGESQTITSTARTLSISSSATFTVSSPVAGIMRISGNLGQRVSRAYGDVTTQWEASVSGAAVKFKYTGTGLAPDFSTIQLGDKVDIGAGFNSLNQGEYLILSKGADYIEFMNPYAQAETAIGIISIFSNGPVQKGDIVDINSAQFAFPNQGTFAVAKVTDQYIEVANANVFPQSITGVTDGVTIFPYAYKWMAMVVDRKTLVGLNGDAPGAIEVEPPVEGDLIKNPGLFLKRGKVFEVQVRNPGQAKLEGFLILAE